MIATIRGARGSVATPGPATVRYGGNTSCVELLLADGTKVVLDAGTGIRELGLRLAADRPPAPIHLLLTHLHLDHVAGLPFFAPLWDATAELHIWGLRPPHESLEDAIARFMSPPLFPVSISEVPARITFHDLPDGVWTLGSAEVSAAPVRHRGPTVGYRVEEGGRSLVYIPDHEPYAGPELLSGFRLARDASILLHDAQHFESEYPAHSGWGHSSVAHAVAFARRARARRLVLFHHDPLHSDEDLELLEARAAELWNGLRPPELAREGMRLTLGPARESPATGKDRGVTTVRPEAGESIISAWSKTTRSTGG
jgi:phosphoribosyl 1,2-cyclic phosphodiesterase